MGRNKNGTEKTVLRALPFCLPDFGLQREDHPATAKSARKKFCTGATCGAPSDTDLWSADVDAQKTWKCGDAAPGE